MRTASIGLLSIVIAAAVVRADENVYVSPEGNDTWSGRLAAPNEDQTDGPFRTLGQAQTTVRAMQAMGYGPEPIVVTLGEGVYVREEPFAIDKQDAGHRRSPTIYKAADGTTVRLIGGRRVTGWQPVEDAAVLNKLDAAARDHVLAADLKAQGITDYGEIVRRGFGLKQAPAGLELFFDGEPMTMARWPNEGFTTIANILGIKPKKVHGVESDAVGRFVYEGDRPARWVNEPDVWLHGFWTWDWADTYEKIAAIDTEKKQITLAEPYHNYGYRKGARFYAVNALVELDSPGEWYLDRASGQLYFWPPKPIDSAAAYVSMIDSLLTVRDTSSVEFHNITFEFCRGTAVTVNNSSDVKFVGCILRNIGNTAINLQECTDCSVIGCEITGEGDGGIIVVGGDRPTLTSSGDEIVNNHLHQYGRWVYTYTPGIRMMGVGVHVANNLIHDAPHEGIELHGNDHLIEFNDIHHVCLITDDCGAFYMGRDYTYRGNTLRYNYFHDIGGYHPLHGANSIYLDDFTSGSTMYGNVIERGARGILIGGGRDNFAVNNILVDCTPAVHIDSRGLGWASNYFDGQYPVLKERLDAVPYREPPWMGRYPELLTLYDENPAMPKDNVVMRNIILGPHPFDLRVPEEVKPIVSARIAKNLVRDETDLVTVGEKGITFSDEAAVAEIGFEPIPFEQIGLRDDLPRPGK